MFHGHKIILLQWISVLAVAVALSIELIWGVKTHQAKH